MQLIVRFATGGYDAWKAAFDAHAEDRDRSGLTLLQLWRGTDKTDLACALFEVHDRKSAQGWLDRQAGLVGGIEADFLKTA